jgi:hypothetical protein
MDEPILYNHSGHIAEVYPVLDREGAEARLVIVKASLAVLPGGGLGPIPVPRELRLGDVPWGAPEIADLRLPADYGLEKPGTDVVVSGHAVPPPGNAASSMDVGIRVADRVKVLRVHGPRTWIRRLGAVVPGPASALERTPLSWSRAYGGADFSDPRRPLEEPRNPVGSGVSRRPDLLVGLPAPQIEDPSEPVTGAGGRIVPAGCAPIGRHFSPRRQRTGTYDGAWLAGAYPGRPGDYDAAHEHCAAPGLVFDSALQGGEAIRIVGMHEQVLDFVLPRQRVRIEARIDGGKVERAPHLDTVVVDTDSLAVEMVWRAVFRCPRKMRGHFPAITVEVKEWLT